MRSFFLRDWCFDGIGALVRPGTPGRGLWSASKDSSYRIELVDLLSEFER